MKLATPSSTFGGKITTTKGTLLSCANIYPFLYVVYNYLTPVITNGLNIIQIKQIDGVTANIEFPSSAGTATGTEVIIPLACLSVTLLQNANES